MRTLNEVLSDVGSNNARKDSGMKARVAAAAVAGVQGEGGVGVRGGGEGGGREGSKGTQTREKKHSGSRC